MKIEVSLLTGQQLKATFAGHEIISDQSIDAGGGAEHPEPFDYFLSSMPLCAAFYMRKFCQQRDIDTTGLSLSQEVITPDEQNPYTKTILMNVSLPNNFPKKYEKAILASANTCTVKKVIQAMPEFEIQVVK